MTMVSRWTCASAVFAALLAISLYGCYSFVSMPPLRSKNNLDLSYVQSAEYGYTAHVKPSLLYDNRTEVSEGEPLYLKLVDRLDITLTYNLTQIPKTFYMADIRLSYEASGTLSGGDWAKTYALKPKVTTDARFSDTYTLDIRDIQGIVEAIGKETGTGIYAYTYEIRPRINLEASAGGEPIVQEFAPTLTIKFDGGKIQIEGLRSTKAGSVTHLETEAATWGFLGLATHVGTMKVASIIASISLAALLAASIRFTLQEMTSRPLLERLSGDIRDKIIEASEPPKTTKREIIKVGSIEDLAKVSEETFKPIIHHEDAFYVLDGDMRYEFTMEKIARETDAHKKVDPIS
jgi:hypothetical protein